MDYFTITIACVLVIVCMARDPFFQRASVVENVQRVVANGVDIRSALFVPFNFFNPVITVPHMTPDFKHALLNMFVDAVPYDMGNIPCANGCKTLLKVRHVHQNGSNGISAYPILLYRGSALKPCVNRIRTTTTLAMRWWLVILKTHGARTIGEMTV